MYEIYCYLPVEGPSVPTEPIEVFSADDIVEVLIPAMNGDFMPGTLCLKNEIEFNDVLVRLGEVIMNQPEIVNEGEGNPEEMPINMPIYHMMPTVDLYLVLKEIATPDTASNLVWEIDNEIVSVSESNSLEFAIGNIGADQVEILNSVHINQAITISSDVVIKLNGNVIQEEKYEEDTVEALFVVESGSLTISGEGQINSCGSAIIVNGGELVIEGAEFYNNDEGAIIVNNEGSITISGGRFCCNEPDNMFVLESGIIILQGGVFVEYDPRNNENIQIGDGYEVVDHENGEYEVVAAVQ